MLCLNATKRERILSLARRAETLAEVEHATTELRRWVQQHPNDLGIRDAFEPLFRLRDFLTMTADTDEPPLTTEVESLL